MAKKDLTRLKQTFNFRKDDIESYCKFLFLISNSPDYKDYLEKFNSKGNKSLAFRNHMESFVCKHDDNMVRYQENYLIFKKKFYKEINPDKEDDKKEKSKHPVVE